MLVDAMGMIATKFIAGVARQNIHLPQFLFNHSGNTGKHAIADRVSVSIV